MYKTTKISLKGLVMRALCIDNLGIHEWNHYDEANRHMDLADTNKNPPTRNHCLKCGTYIFQYYVALHLINNETIEFEEYPTWSGKNPTPIRESDRDV